MAQTDVTACKVALITGGWSDEREIALESARACHKALVAAGFEQVDLMDIAERKTISRLVSGDYDVAFIAMHGELGEDGAIQGLCEAMRIPYTFSGVLASAMAAEKQVAKTVYKEAGIPIARGLDVADISEVDVDRLVRSLGFPMFVKPAANGSSYGITRVTDASQLPAAIELATSKGDRALIEECVEGTEITVPVIGNGASARALPIIEINTGAEFYDLKVKYEPSELHHVIPARLPEEAYARAQELAVAAHLALGCADVSRSDFIVTEDGTPVILETNTIPGMTETSLLPDSARHAGIEFPELCRSFVEMALERAGRGA